jgi:hypothetical protein
MFTTEIELTQQTPLIHFNASEKGASLRLTELKPKLDRYLIEALGGREETLQNHRFWLKGFDFTKKGDDLKKLLKTFDISFDYSVQFVETPRSSEHHPQFLNGKDNPFFGNMGGSDKYKLVSTNQPIKLKFTSLHPKLLEKIEGVLSKFIDLTNFGTRQSKGFGSFSLIADELEVVKNELPFRFTVAVGKAKYPETVLFKSINLFYKCLRSGINELGSKDWVTHQQDNLFYFKSLLFMYAKDPANQWGKSIQWDKKTIKQELQVIGEGHKKQQKYFKTPDETTPLWYENENKFLIRDLLGLSSSEKWLSYKATINKKAKDELIQRFKSPIIFKPVFDPAQREYTVYFGGVTTNVFTNQTVEIKSDRNKQDLELTTPDKFDVNKFLNYVVEKNIKVHKHATKAAWRDEHKVIEHFDNDSPLNETGRILANIFESLEKNNPSNE